MRRRVELSFLGTLAVSALLHQPVFAQTSCASCDAAEQFLESETDAVRASGLALTRLLNKTDYDLLTVLVVAEDRTCEYVPCGELSSKQAADLARLVLLNKRHSDASEINTWIALGTVLSAGIACLSLLLSFVVATRSGRNERRSRENEKRLSELENSSNLSN